MRADAGGTAAVPRTTGMNTQTLDLRKVAAEVRDRITGWPETHNQERWLRLADGKYGGFEDLLEGKTAAAWSECGTTDCADGHIAAVAIKYNSETTDCSIFLIAKKAMGLTGGTVPWIFRPDRSRQETLGWLEAVAAGEPPDRIRPSRSPHNRRNRITRMSRTLTETIRPDSNQTATGRECATIPAGGNNTRRNPMTAPTFDPRKIAVEVRDRITGWPETHDQGQWLQLADGTEGSPEDLIKGKTAAAWAECGTTACAAGHIAATALADNPELLDQPASEMFLYYSLSYSLAVEVMGLPTDMTQQWIFCADRTLQEILDWLDAVAAGENPQTASDRLEALAAAGTG